MRRRRCAAALLAAGIAAVGIVPAASGALKPVHKTTKVGDYFLSPKRLTVAKGSTMRWKWLSTNGDAHDVKLKRAPKGVKKFHSAIATTDYSYPRKAYRFRVRGRYVVICTLHPSMMRQVITVK